MTFSDFLLFVSLFFVLCGFSLFLYFTLFSKLFFHEKQKTTPEGASFFGDFINGLTGPIFALGGVLIIFSTIIKQNSINNIQHFESLFYKQLDYHRDNCNNISILSPKSCNYITGGAVWVSYYAQIKKAYQIIHKDSLLKIEPYNKKIDLAFATFFFGISNLDTVRLNSHFVNLNLPNESKTTYFSNLKSLDHCDNWKSYFSGQSNKYGTFVKQYFSFINYVNNKKTLSLEQKKEYIKLLQEQNDNFCQLVIYYYLASSLCQENERVMSSKYNIISEIDSSLLFHQKTVNEE